jgi:hypothetical protein
MESDDISIINEQHERTCITCDNHFIGRFCNVCGEKVLEPGEKSLKLFFGNILNALTFIDNKFFKTLKLHLTKPGFVTYNYINGKRVPFIKPISMFFIINLLYFLFSIFETYNSKLYTQMHWLPHSEIAKEMVEKRVEREQVSIESFTIQYEQQSTSMAKLLLIIFVFLSGIFVALINMNAHMYFIDHIMVSLEFNSIFILVCNVILPWVIILIGLVMKPWGVDIDVVFQDEVFSTLMAAYAIFLFYKIEQTVYQQRVGWALVKAILFIPGLFVSLQLYRAVLFFITLWTV